MANRTKVTPKKGAGFLSEMNEKLPRVADQEGTHTHEKLNHRIRCLQTGTPQGYRAPQSPQNTSDFR